MAAAIVEGLPKLRIEEAAARTQARIDSNRQSVVGVNRYKPEVADFLRTYLNNPTKVKDAYIAQPVLKQVGRELGVALAQRAEELDDGGGGVGLERAVLRVAGGQLDGIAAGGHAQSHNQDPVG